jgi:hypothetical protein
MKRSVLIRAGVAGLVLLLAGLGFWLAPRRDTAPAVVEATVRGAAPTTRQVGRGAPDGAALSPVSGGTGGGPWSAEKAARVEKIKRDYDEVHVKAAADYAAGGKNFPGGLNGYLRQLALLDREKRADLAAVLTARELEDLELTETVAGQTVRRLLGDTAATEEQRRAVFRLQREFEDRFALTFDLAPKALLEREHARAQTAERIREVIGDTLFHEWLKGEGMDYPQLAAMLERRGLPTSTGLELWRVRTEFTLRRLELNAGPAMTSAQQRATLAALIRQTEVRLIGILGAGTVQMERDTALQWLPKP